MKLNNEKLTSEGCPFLGNSESLEKFFGQIQLRFGISDYQLFCSEIF